MKRSSSELKRIARGALRGRYPVFVGAMVLYMVIAMLAFCIPSCAFPVNSSYTAIIIRLIVTFLITLMIQLLAVGISRIGLCVSRGLPAGISDLFYGFRFHPDRFLVVFLIFAGIGLVFSVPSDIAAYTVGIFSWQYCLLLLLSTAVSTVLSMFFGFAVMLLIDHPDLTAINALRESARLLGGHRWRYFYVSTLSFVGLAFLAILSLSIAFLWLVPYMIVTQAVFYRELCGEI